MSLPKAPECDLCDKHPAKPTYNKFGTYQHICIYLCQSCMDKLRAAEDTIFMFIGIAMENAIEKE